MKEEVTTSFGFVFGYYHSETIDYLLEVLSEVYAQPAFVIYNLTNDWYNNLEIYEKKYKNVKIITGEDCQNALMNETHSYIFLVSMNYNVQLLFGNKYKSKIIAMVHSEQEIQQCKNFGFRYFSLTPLLSENNYTLPIVRNIQATNRSISISNVKLGEKEINDEAGYIKRNNLTPILMIGNTFHENKNLSLLSEIVNTNRIYLIVCTKYFTDELKRFANDHYGYVNVGINLSTSQIKVYTEKLSIEHLLFCPKKDSTFYKSQFSGNIAFALNNGYKLILPKRIAKIYDLNNSHVITYDDTITTQTNTTQTNTTQTNTTAQAITTNVLNKKLSEKEIQNYRNLQFNRNKLVLGTFISK